MKFILQTLKCTNCGHLAIGLRDKSGDPTPVGVVHILTGPCTCKYALWDAVQSFPCKISRQASLHEVILDASEEDTVKSAQETLSRITDLLGELDRRGK